MKMTFEINLMNRVKPQGMDDYKKMWKPPVRLRTSDADHLNRFTKEVELPIDYQAREVWGKEIGRLTEACPDWGIQARPGYGDMLIGCISVQEYDDFYREIYLPVRNL